MANLLCDARRLGDQYGLVVKKEERVKLLTDITAIYQQIEKAADEVEERMRSQDDNDKKRWADIRRI